MTQRVTPPVSQMSEPNAAAATETLVTEVTKKVRELGTLIWLDADAHYVGFVDGLRDRWSGSPYSVVRFDGSYLELMLALKDFCGGAHPDKLLVHLPGLNKETVKETPVFELYKAGKVFEKALATVVREAAVGLARPEEIDAFVRAPGLSLEAADRWLEGQRERPTDKVSLLLDALGTDEVVLDLVRGHQRLATQLPEQGEKVFAYLERTLGVTRAWRSFVVEDAELGPSAMSTLVASWLMSIEFVHDLKEAPVTPELAALGNVGPFAKDCRRLASKLRALHPDLYESAATDLQERLSDERKSHHAGALGSIDTFRFEEETVRSAVLAALRDSRWEAGAAHAEHRTTEDCFWVKRSHTLQRTWEVLRHAAKLGVDLLTNANALSRCGSLDEAVAIYADKLAPVDRQHRIFEQRFSAQVRSDLEDHDALLEVRAAVRRAYRQWADELTRAFHELCIRDGALPSRGLRQRAVYADEVHPRLEAGGRVAYVMVDALRFEMAQALAAELSREKARVHVAARLAELPTITAVGMNALAPVEHSGRLRPVVSEGDLKGFSAGEFRVCDPADRVRAMSKRSLDASAVVDVPLDEFHSMTFSDLQRRIRGKSLVVVRSLDLDTAGETGLHLSTFERTLTQLKSALSMLGQAGIQQIVVASDHGFLLQDATVDNVPFGATMRVPSRRHAILRAPSGMADVLELPLKSLEYDVDDELYLVFRPDTSVWKTSHQVASFVHGGNSLQERVIPVLTIEREGARGKTMSRYEVVARAEPSHLGRQRLCVSIRLQTHTNLSLGFVAPKHISLALRIPGDSGATQITLLDARPPASLLDGRILVAPNKDEALVEFELEGPVDDKVRVEIFHPEATEEVTPKLVEGFFDVARDRRLGKVRDGSSVPPPSSRAPAIPSADPVANFGASEADSVAGSVGGPVGGRPAGASPERAPEQGWASLIEDEAFRKVLEIVAERRSINEEELVRVLGNARRVRTFAREFDRLRALLPFDVEVLTVQGMKAYARKD